MQEPTPKRVSRACDACRKKKIRCDGTLPKCYSCKAFDRDCTYLDTAKKRGPPKGYIEAIQARLEKMEEILGSFIPEDDHSADPSRSTKRRKRENSWQAKLAYIDRLLSEANVLQKEPSSDSASSSASSLTSSSSTSSKLKDRSTSLGKRKLTPHNKDAATIASNYNISLYGSNKNYPLTLLKELPGPPFSDRFISVYFARLHPFHPILHQPSFMESFYSPTPPDPLLLFSIYAIAATVAVEPYESYRTTLNRNKAAVFFFNKAKTLLQDVFDTSDLTTIQSLILLAQYQHECAGELISAWMYIGIAVRMSYDLNLHHSRDPPLPPSSQSLIVSKDDILQELSNRAWWSCYTMDTLISMAVGRPFAVRSYSYEQAFPRFLADEQSTFFSNDCFVNFLIPAIKTCKLFRKFLDDLYFNNEDPFATTDPDFSNNLETLSWDKIVYQYSATSTTYPYLSNPIWNWFFHLDNQLCSQILDERFSVPQPFGSFLKMLHGATTLFLSAPLIRNNSPSASRINTLTGELRLDLLKDSKCSPYWLECVDAASGVVNSAYDMLCNNQLRQTWMPFTIYCLFQASMIHLSIVISTSGNSYLSDRTSNAIATMTGAHLQGGVIGELNAELDHIVRNAENINVCISEKICQEARQHLHRAIKILEQQQDFLISASAALRLLKAFLEFLQLGEFLDGSVGGGLLDPQNSSPYTTIWPIRLVRLPYTFIFKYGSSLLEGSSITSTATNTSNTGFRRSVGDPAPADFTHHHHHHHHSLQHHHERQPPNSQVNVYRNNIPNTNTVANQTTIGQQRTSSSQQPGGFQFPDVFSIESLQNHLGPILPEHSYLIQSTRKFWE